MESKKNLNHFQRLNDVKELKLISFVQCGSTVRPDPRRWATHGSCHVSAAWRAADQQVYYPASLSQFATHVSLHSQCDVTCILGGGFPGYDTRFSLPRGCCCQGKEVVSVNHIKGKRFLSRLTFGSKMRLIARIEPCILDFPVAVSTRHDAVFFLNRLTCFTLMTARLSCITLF